MQAGLSLFSMRYLKYSAIAIISCCICLLTPLTIPVAAKSHWVVQSNTSAELLFEAISADECQEKIGVGDRLREINPAFKTCRNKNIIGAVRTLEQKLDRVKNPELRLDLEILLEFGRQRLRSYELDEQYRLPYIDLSEAILEDLQALADRNVSSQQISTKLRQYAGLESHTALASKLERAIETQLQKSEFVLPNQKWLEEDLKGNARQISKILAFLEERDIPDDRPAYAALKTQLYEYETFIRTQVLPLAKRAGSFRLPPELYAFQLAENGIEIPVEELIEQAHTAFSRIQQQMNKMAQKIAQERGVKISSYRDVIQLFQQERLSAEETLKLYQKRSQQLETIIERENLVTLPDNKFKIRLATASEKKNFPVPLYDSDSSTFVLPVFQNPKKAEQYNDFTNPAMSWTLTVHEGRPGHDLQFAVLDRLKLSDVRSGMIRNASNVEGWATYAEIMMLPYLPLEGQFMSLQFQLLRAARAFLEAELQAGKITKTEALKVLTVDAGFSEFFAKQEIERYTTRIPGQAPAYFYGSQKLLQLKEQAEETLGAEFTLKKFHDFVLSQGFLTPKQLERVLMSKLNNNIDDRSF